MARNWPASRAALAADLRKGNRPSFIRAAPPDVAEPLYDHFCTRLRETGLTVATGRFGAQMAVHLTNDGPVTIWLDSAASDRVRRGTLGQAALTCSRPSFRPCRLTLRS
jgi:D-Tyr-tRNA(Tyr) deacylase